MHVVINGSTHQIPKSLEKAKLLWFLREHLHLVGSKYGCGVGACGACTVHLNGQAARSCSLTMHDIDAANIVTIEGLAESAEQLHPVQQAWIEESVPQCGYCQAGQIMSASALLSHNATPSDTQIDAAMSGNLCRCGTYDRIRKAIHRASNNNRGDQT